MIKVVYVYPPLHGTGHHPWRYMAFYEGDELKANTPRGWGQTAREAESALKGSPLMEKETER